MRFIIITLLLLASIMACSVKEDWTWRAQVCKNNECGPIKFGPFKDLKACMNYMAKINADSYNCGRNVILALNV